MALSWPADALFATFSLTTMKTSSRSQLAILLPTSRFLRSILGVCAVVGFSGCVDGWYTPTHYGPVGGRLWNEIKRQLEASGLFKVTLKSTEWNQYSEAAFTRQVPDFYSWAGSRTTRTPTTTVAVPCSTAASSNNRYDNPEVERSWSPRRAPPTTRARARRRSRRSRTIAAEDAPEHPDLGGRSGRRGPRTGVNGRRGDLRPGVHLPLLADHEGQYGKPPRGKARGPDGRDVDGSTRPRGSHSRGATS